MLLSFNARALSYKLHALICVEFIGFISDILGADKFDIIRFVYQPTNDTKTSATVSFHITERERQDVLKSFYLPENQEKVKRLINLLDN